MMQPCPCCGWPTLREPGVWEVCEVCAWEDDPVARRDPTWPSPPNHGVTLAEARAAWAVLAEYGGAYPEDAPPPVPRGGESDG